jgi:hypothetical protein
MTEVNDIPNIYTYKNIFDELFKIAFNSTNSKNKSKMHEKVQLLYNEFNKLRKNITVENDNNETDIHKDFEKEANGKFQRKDNKPGFRYRRKDVFLTYSKDEKKKSHMLQHERNIHSKRTTQIRNTTFPCIH